MKDQLSLLLVALVVSGFMFLSIRFLGKEFYPLVNGLVFVGLLFEIRRLRKKLRALENQPRS